MSPKLRRYVDIFSKKNIFENGLISSFLFAYFVMKLPKKIKFDFFNTVSRLHLSNENF